MLPFGANIVNSMRGDDCFGIFVCTPQCDYRKVLVANGSNYIFIDFPENKLKKIQRYIYPRELINTIKSVCQENDIQIIHLLTEDSSLAFFIKYLKLRAKVYYTVHDLFSHEKIYKNLLILILRKILVDFRVSYIIKRTENLVTCNQFQYDCLLKRFPAKQIHFHNFPSLITETIKSGGVVVPELQGIENYILFFGMIERYKGVDILYDAYLNHAGLTGKTLVIAGKGHIYFKRSEARENQVIFINRYIRDEEIKFLFAKAYCAVFPYISGTQSGILSLPYFFKTPTIVSDIPFFKGMILNNITSASFHLHDKSSLMTQITELNELNIEKFKNEAYLFYQKKYDASIIRQQLKRIYNE